MKVLSIIPAVLLLLFVSVVDGQIRTEQEKGQAAVKLTPFSGILKNAESCFKGNSAVYHCLAAASTYLIIQSDADYKVQKYFAGNEGMSRFAGPAAWTGYIAPVILGGGIYLYGQQKGDNEIIAAGSAVIQAMLISVTYSSLLKAITGRPGPDPEKFPDMKEASRRFRFGFMRGGIHYGWPSGHLIVNTAAVTSLMYFYKGKGWIKIAGGLYLAYLAAGVTAHEKATMHWLSDVAAGTIMGFAIGAVVGENFRKNFMHGSPASEETVRLLPVISADYQVLTFQIPL